MKVLIGTPCHTWNLHTKYVDSLINTKEFCRKIGIEVHHCFLCGESLVQLARNDLFKIAYENNVDKLFFIDDDMYWNPEDFVKLLNSEHQIIAVAGRKKTDEEIFAINVGDHDFNGQEEVIPVKGIGAAFMCFSKEAIKKLYEDAPFYQGPKGIGKMVFDIGIIDGELYSEDHLLCKKWRDLGGQIMVDINISLGHIGQKDYIGSVGDFVRRKVYELNKDILEKRKEE